MDDDSIPFVEPIKLQKPLGVVRFAADRTRPDLDFACSFVARFAANPKAPHIDLIMRIIKYLVSTRDELLVLGSISSTVVLTASADASFIRGDDSKSQLAYCLFLSDDSGTVMAKSQRDKAVSISSFQSETHALTEVIKTIIWFRELLNELNFPCSTPTVIYQDNTAVIESTSRIGKDSQNT